MNTWTHICVKNYLKFIWCVLWRLVWGQNRPRWWPITWPITADSWRERSETLTQLCANSLLCTGFTGQLNTGYSHLAEAQEERRTTTTKSDVTLLHRDSSLIRKQDQCSADPFTPDPSSKNHAFNFLQHNVCIHRLFIIEALLDWFLFNHLSDNRTYRSATFSITKNTDRPHPPVGGGAWSETQVASYCTSNELAPLPRSLMSPPTVWGLLIRHPLQQEDHGRPVCPPPRPETTSCASK